MIREIVKMLNQYAVDYPTFPVNQRYSHLFAILAGCRAATMGRQVFGARMVFQESFLQIQRRLLHHLIQKDSIHGSLMYQNTHHRMWWVKAKHQLRIRDASQDRQPEIHSRFSKNYEADQQRLQISDLHFDKFTTPATFACWKIRFKTEVCTCSQFPTEAMLWIKEVEMGESVGDLKSSRSTRGIRMPDLTCSMRRLLQHWTESSIILTSKEESVWRKWKLKKKTSSSEEDRSLTWSTSTSGSLSQRFCRELCGPIYKQLFFDMMIFRNSIRNGTEFYYQWRRIPSDDILEGMYKLRMRESEKLKNVLELYDLEIHQKTAGPDYHRLKTMVKRSIEHNLRHKNFGARYGNYETSAVVNNQGTKQREQRSQGDCWQWKANGQCSKGDNCSFRHDMNKRAKPTQPNPSPRSSTQQSVQKKKHREPRRSPRGRSPSGRIARLPCKDCFKGTCSTPFCEKWHPPECLFYMSENGGRFG